MKPDSFLILSGAEITAAKPGPPAFFWKPKQLLLYLFGIILFVSEAYLVVTNPDVGYKEALLGIDIIIFLVLAFYDTAFCLNIAVMLIPFHSVLLTKRVEIVTLDVFTGAVIVLSFVCLLQVIIGKLKYRRPGAFDLLLYAFGFFALSFLIFGQDIVHSGYFYFHNIAIPTLMFFLTRVLVKDEQAYELLKIHIIVSASLAACAVIILFAVTHERVDQFRSLECSIFLIMAILILISIRRKRAFALAGLNFIGLLFCFSRTPLFSFLASPVLFAGIRKGFGKIFFLGLALTSLIGTLALPAIFDTGSYYAMRQEFERKRSFSVTEAQMDKSFERITDFDYIILSLRGRFDMWRTDISSFYEHPLLGVGVGTTRIKGVVSSHNLHVQLLSSMGLIGFILFHAALVAAIPGRSDTVRPLHHDYSIFAVMLFIYYINGLTNGLFHGAFNYTFFLVLGLMQNIRSLFPDAKTIEK